tara:strand:- start:3908 stop:4594 length:687 start_codon:yes stop_codon:yes gene_type:complete
MARISTYNLDNTVSKNDKVIGTDSSGSSTKNFKLSDVIQLVNDSGLLNIGDLLTFQYNTSNSYGSLNLTTGGPSFSTISKITVSHSDLSNQNIKDLLDYLVGQNIIISQTDNKNNFGHFVFNGLTQAGSTNFSVMSISHLESNDGLVLNKYYTMSLSNKGQSDKNFVSNDITFSAGVGQEVNHNLGKRPTVVLVDSAGTEVVADIQHNSTTQITVTTTSSFTGTIYAN